MAQAFAQRLNKICALEVREAPRVDVARRLGALHVDTADAALVARAASTSLAAWGDDEPAPCCFDQILAQIDALPFAPEVLLLSFHGVPRRTLMLGDPYHCQCLKTARLLGERLGLGRQVAELRQRARRRARRLARACDRHRAGCG